MFESTLLGIPLSRPSLMKRSHCSGMTPFPDVSFALLVRIEIPITVNPVCSTIFGVNGTSPETDTVNLIERLLQHGFQGQLQICMLEGIPSPNKLRWLHML